MEKPKFKHDNDNLEFQVFKKKTFQFPQFKYNKWFGSEKILERVGYIYFAKFPVNYENIKIHIEIDKIYSKDIKLGNQNDKFILEFEPLLWKNSENILFKPENQEEKGVYFDALIDYIKNKDLLLKKKLKDISIQTFKEINMKEVLS